MSREPAPGREAPALFDTMRGAGADARPAATAESAPSAGGAGSSAPETTTASPPESPADAARLAPEARRALVSLLKQGAIRADDKRLLYEAIVRHRVMLEAHLADMYLRLLVDERAGVVVLLQQPDDSDDDDEDAVALITRRTLSLYDTLLVLVLRKHYQERQTVGEQSVFIDIDQIEARLSPFLPLTTSTRSERRRLSAALDKMVDRRLLARVRGDEERFEVTPVIRYVVNAAALEQLLEQYRTLAEQTAAGTGG